MSAASYQTESLGTPAATAELPGTPGARRRRGAFWLVGLTLVAFLAASSAPSPLYVVFQERWGFSALTLTTVFASYAIALLVALVTVGGISDFVGRRPVLLAALALEAVSMVVFLVAHDVPLLVLARVVQGLATGAATGVASAALVDLQPAGTQLGGVVNGAAATGGLALAPWRRGCWCSTPRTPRRSSSWAARRLRAARGSAVLPARDGHPPARGAEVPGAAARGPAAGAGDLRGGAAHRGGDLVDGRALPLPGAVDRGRRARPHQPSRGGAGGHRVHRPGRSPRSPPATVRAGDAGGRRGPGRRHDARRVGRAHRRCVASSSSHRTPACRLRHRVPRRLPLTGRALAGPEQRAELLAAVYVVSYLAFSLPAIAAGLLVPRLGLQQTATGYGVVVVVLALMVLLIAAAGRLVRRARV